MSDTEREIMQNETLTAETVENTADVTTEPTEPQAIVVPTEENTPEVVDLRPLDENGNYAGGYTDHPDAVAPTEVEDPAPGTFPMATVTNANGIKREYSYEVHGEGYAELAEQFAVKVGGKVIYG